jgi:antitoxin (DNA-binding transcriptional repressor) of toxin-antitoxin stability system
MQKLDRLLKWMHINLGVAMQVTATEAKNQFSKICAQAKIEPVFVYKNGKPVSVIVSHPYFQNLRHSTSNLNESRAS